MKNNYNTFDKSYLFSNNYFCLSENELSLISHETQKQYVKELSQIFSNSNQDSELQHHVAKAKHMALQNIKKCKDIQDFLLTDDEYNMLRKKNSYYETLTNLISKNKGNKSVIAAIATAKVNYLTNPETIFSGKIDKLKLSKAEYDLISEDKKNEYKNKLEQEQGEKHSSNVKDNISTALNEIKNT